jgi:hypothetical protein
MQNSDPLLIAIAAGVGLVGATLWYFYNESLVTKKILAERALSNSTNPKISENQIITRAEPTLMGKEAILNSLPWYVDICLSINDFTLVVGVAATYYVCLNYVYHIFITGDEIEAEVTKLKRTYKDGVLTNTEKEIIEVALSRTLLFPRRIAEVFYPTFFSRFLGVVGVVADWYSDSKDPRTLQEFRELLAEAVRGQSKEELKKAQIEKQ